MSQTHQLQLQRFELKYAVPEATALKVRDFVRSYLDVDEFGEGQPPRASASDTRVAVASGAYTG